MSKHEFFLNLTVNNPLTDSVFVEDRSDGNSFPAGVSAITTESGILITTESGDILTTET